MQGMTILGILFLIGLCISAQPNRPPGGQGKTQKPVKKDPKIDYCNNEVTTASNNDGIKRLVETAKADWAKFVTDVGDTAKSNPIIAEVKKETLNGVDTLDAAAFAKIPLNCLKVLTGVIGTTAKLSKELKENQAAELLKDKKIRDDVRLLIAIIKATKDADLPPMIDTLITGNTILSDTMIDYKALVLHTMAKNSPYDSYKLKVTAGMDCVYLSAILAGLPTTETIGVDEVAAKIQASASCDPAEKRKLEILRLLLGAAAKTHIENKIAASTTIADKYKYFVPFLSKTACDKVNKNTHQAIITAVKDLKIWKLPSCDLKKTKEVAMTVLDQVLETEDKSSRGKGKKKGLAKKALKDSCGAVLIGGTDIPADPTSWGTLLAFADPTKIKTFVDKDAANCAKICSGYILPLSSCANTKSKKALANCVMPDADAIDAAAETKYGCTLGMQKVQKLKSLDASKCSSNLVSSILTPFGNKRQEVALFITSFCASSITLDAANFKANGEAMTKLPLSKYDSATATTFNSLIDDEEASVVFEDADYSVLIRMLDKLNLNVARLKKLITMGNPTKVVSSRKVKEMIRSMTKAEIADLYSSPELKSTRGQSSVVYSVVNAMISTWTADDIKSYGPILKSVVNGKIVREVFLKSMNMEDAVDRLRAFGETFCQAGSSVSMRVRKAFITQLEVYLKQFQPTGNLYESLPDEEVEAYGTCFSAYNGPLKDLSDFSCLRYCESIGNEREGCLKDKFYQEAFTNCSICFKDGAEVRKLKVEDLAVLGPNMACRISADDYTRLISDDATFESTLETFGGCYNIPNALKAKIEEKIKAKDKAFWTSDRLDQAYRLIQLIPNNKVDASQLYEVKDSLLMRIKNDRKSDNYACYVKSLSDAERLKIKSYTDSLVSRITSAVYEALTSAPARRRKRSTKTITCDIAQDYAVDTLTAEEIKNIPAAELAKCLSTFSCNDNWSDAQKQEFYKLINANLNAIFGKTTFGSLTSADLKNMCNFLTELSDADIKTLKLDDAEVKLPVGKAKNYKPDKLTKVADQYKSKVAESGTTSFDASKLTTKDIIDLGNIFFGLSADDISKIPASSIFGGSTDAAALFKEIKTAPAATLQALAKKAKNVHGDSTNTWSKDVVSDIGVSIAGLDKEDIKKISSEAKELIEPNAISNMPPDTFAASFTANELAAFSESQSKAVTVDQKAKLSNEQKKGLGEPVSNGVALSASFFTMVLVALVTLFF